MIFGCGLSRICECVKTHMNLQRFHLQENLFHHLLARIELKCNRFECASLCCFFVPIIFWVDFEEWKRKKSQFHFFPSVIVVTSKKLLNFLLRVRCLIVSLNQKNKNKKGNKNLFRDSKNNEQFHDRKNHNICAIKCSLVEYFSTQKRCKMIFFRLMLRLRWLVGIRIVCRNRTSYFTCF